MGFQLFENHFLYPVVMSKTVGMNPLWVLIAVLIGANLGGAFGSGLGALTGAIVAIPVAGALQMVFKEVPRPDRPRRSRRTLVRMTPGSQPSFAPRRRRAVRCEERGARKTVMSSLCDLTGKVAIVTGGGTGIGAATALLFAQQGADVVIAARTLDDLERTRATITRETERRCVIVPTDVKVEEQDVALVSQTIEALGRVDILVNNAGGTRMGPLASLPTKGWDASFDLNVRSAYFCTREAGRHMIEQGSGAIVNISSDAGIHGVKGGAHYASSKAALQMFTTVTAAEWGRYGIRGNCVAVGAVASERAGRLEGGAARRGVDGPARAARADRTARRGGERHPLLCQ